MSGELHDALAGTVVVALATNVPGPLAAARLRALGARVVKIEPLRGDPLAAAAPAWYAEATAGVERLQLDFREGAARAALDLHLETADVLMTAMRASSLERIGVAWPRLSERYPALSLISITGEAPPHDDRAGHDLTYQARAGLVDAPALPRTLVADMAAAERAVTAALAALARRSRTGRGTHANVSIVDCARAFAAPYVHGLTRHDGELGGALSTYALYAAEDGWVAVAALEPHFLERLRNLLHVGSLDRASLAAAFRTRSAREWERLAEEHDIPMAAVR